MVCYKFFAVVVYTISHSSELIEDFICSANGLGGVGEIVMQQLSMRRKIGATFAGTIADCDYKIKIYTTIFVHII